MRKNCCPEAETLVLSGMICNEDNLCLGIESLKELDFAILDHQILFSAMHDLYKEGSRPGMEKIALKLKEKNLLDGVGGVSKIAEILGGNVSSKEDLEDYINIVKDHALFRQIEGAHAKLCQILDDPRRGNSADILSDFKATLTNLENLKIGCLGIDFDSNKDEFITKLKKKMSKETPEIMLSSGLKSLDCLTGGLEGGRLITIAARPSMGKTVLAINMAVSLAKQHKPVYFFSIEMAYGEIEERIYSQLAMINQKEIHLGLVTSEQIESLCLEAKKIKKGMLLIDDKSGIKIEEIVSKSKRAKGIFNISAIFIDYLQLINSKEHSEYRHLEIANFTRALKALAKNLNIPVICLAQLSRKVEERADHKPLMSDLKESGAIEQDSDQVLTIHRRDFYDPFDHPGESEIHVLKNRHGATGVLRLRFDKEHSQFLEINP